MTGFCNSCPCFFFNSATADFISKNIRITGKREEKQRRGERERERDRLFVKDRKRDRNIRVLGGNPDAILTLPFL
jgi:hypothetical protein